jgi:hypothetical protein
MSRLSSAGAVVYGGLVVGVLDLADAFIFFGLRSGARPMGILHSIAAGVLGRDAARAGGAATATLGLLLHFTIAVIIAAIYVAASRHAAVLRRRWIVCGITYGVIAYFVMTYIVVPLSNAGGATRPAFVLPVFLNGILIHAFGVGLPAAYFASRTGTSQEPYRRHEAH